MEKTKTRNKKNAVAVFFEQNPLVKTVYIDGDDNIYLSYNAKENLKKVTRK